MLLNYKFRNYKSYKNDTNIDMVANSDKTHINNLIPFNKKNASRVKIIYGANASGKTSIINSIDFVRNYAVRSNILLENDAINVDPFKFCKNCFENPSSFEIDFVKNNIRYNYSFSITREEVIDEKLDVYYSNKATNIFTRVNNDEFKFNYDTKILNDIKTKTTKNKLFLLSAATWNYEKVKPVVEYIINDIVVLYDMNQPIKYNIDFIMKNNDYEDYKNFCLSFLNNADFSIDDIETKTHKISENKKSFETLSKILDVLADSNDKNEGLLDDDIYEVKTIHNILNDKGLTKYRLDLIEESMGTRVFFELAPVFYYVLKGGKTLFIDEIDKSLHPILVKYIINMFLDSDINKSGAQLICNTHDTNLLDLDVFRRDEILFTDRDNETGISEIYKLSDFSPRKDENIEKAYLLGRFGAIPFVKE